MIDFRLRPDIDTELVWSSWHALLAQSFGEPDLPSWSLALTARGNIKSVSPF